MVTVSGPTIDRLFAEHGDDITRQLRSRGITHVGYYRARARLPYEVVHLDWRVPLPEGSGCFAANSNGLASGNLRVEARVHALSELIERDALALWHAGGPVGQAKRRIDIDSIDDPDACDLIERFRSAGVDLAVWDLTAEDLGVPVFRVLALDRDLGGFLATQPAGGSGCRGSIATTRCR